MQENDLGAYLFHQGTNSHAQDYMGHHYEGDRIVFRVWAPGADRIDLVGDFNLWQDDADHFRRVTDAGVWEASIDASRTCEGDTYKFKVWRWGNAHLKADPYAFYGEALEKTASILWRSDYKWGDRAYLKSRGKYLAKDGKPSFSQPINIYEMHLGSWRTRDGRCTVDGDAYLNYREIADMLIPYVKKMGYTHVELMPITEHPFDGSWGYQVCSYFAPTSRYGTPDDFKYFVDELHKAGVGVILDWVPAHFPKDEHGLYEFDGAPLYEYQGHDRMENRGWGTRCFDVGRNEVQSFLISSALYWIEEYHIDGLRIDAVAAMLYLDYDKEPGKWVPNSQGGRENLESIAFFKKLNGTVLGAHPDVMMIAEESTAFGAVTGPTYDGGLGFNFKWNMGWSNDMFDYLATDPYFRAGSHDKLTFPLMYAFSERYILPISHDEVVHGKKSLIDKIADSYENRFPTMRAFLTYMMTTPGKKMLFMGCEYGQFREWDYENQLEWFMTEYESHDMLQYFVSKLNHFYLKNKPLWECDFSWAGYKWLRADDASANTISYMRYDLSGGCAAVIVNFSGSEHPAYPLEVGEGKWRIAFSTDDEEFGGTGNTRSGKVLEAVDGVIKIDIQPRSAAIIKPIKRKERHNV